MSRRSRLLSGYLTEHLVGVDELCLWACGTWWLLMSLVNLDNSAITRTLHGAVRSELAIRLVLAAVVSVHGVGIFTGRPRWRRAGCDAAAVMWVLITALQVITDPLNTATGSYGLLIVPLALWRCWALHTAPRRKGP